MFSTFSSVPITVVSTSLSSLSTPWSTQTLSNPPLCASSPQSAKLTHDPDLEHQKILGFGGAFTEAASLNFNALSEKGREEVLRLLFSKDGLGYNLGRTHINSCDFSPKSYSFSSTPDDFDLTHFDFSVSHDQETMIPFMKRASDELSQSWDTDLKIIASPWSPPAWMKKRVNSDAPRSMLGSAPDTCLRAPEEYAQVWALYFEKWIEAYANQSISIWGVTVQNEPEFAAPWEACQYNPETELSFVTSHLGPLLRASHPDLKILGFDHNKDHVNTWSDKLSPSPYIDGIAYHWYAGGMDRLLDGAQGTANLHRLKSTLKPDDFFLGTEACHCPSTGYAGGDVKVAWKRAERNVHAVLADLAAGSRGSIEWNLLLDKVGGPNHLGNVCDAPLLALPDKATSPQISMPAPFGLPDFETQIPVDPPAGDSWSASTHLKHGSLPSSVEVGVLIQPMYWTTGHITRFLRPNSTPITSLMSGNNVLTKGGVNDLGRVGIELTFFPCEGSNRQTFTLDASTREIKTPSSTDPNKFVCLSSKNDPGFKGLLLTTCDADLPENTNSTSGKYEVAEEVIVNVEDGSCLGFMELENGGNAVGIRSGSQLSSFDDQAKCKGFELYDDEFHHEGLDVCLTTGWPQLQGLSFNDAEGNVVSVLLNEGEEDVKVEIDGIRFDVEGHSVKTIKFG
ncbi:hypothetical protein TrVE_jg3382 [Triparma verrucosa]|uniref:Glycosyl hydrolase family 30 TIM-barrel domain-containing protein n=1 Tax=Triparma verrucosa TaxID=1606542 RepID=A0A9W7B7V3_9STRA|nr:hypothetical protein TrVE_jg3382 [Triparma verrucosa]